MSKIANKINKILPLYIPANARFTDRLQLAMWNCGYCKYHNSLWKTLKDIRITIRKNHHPIFVIKKGAV